MGKHTVNLLQALAVAALLPVAGCSLHSIKDGNAEASKGTPERHIFNPAGWTVEDGLSSALIIGVQVSPDGSEIAYTAMRAHFTGGFNGWTSEIYVSGAGGSRKRQIGAGLGMVDSPKWSPDGSQIAFLSTVVEGNLKGSRQIFRSPSACGESEILTAAPNGITGFSWSPKGGQFVFTSPDIVEPVPGPGGPADDAVVADANATRINLWLVDAKPKTEPKRMTKGDYSIESYAWAPDEKSIAFTHSRASAPEGWHSDISVVDIATGKVTLLAGTPAAEMQPLFSPDGSTIAFIRGENPTADFSGWRVELLPMPGSLKGIARTLAATPNEMPILIGWSADGKTLFFEEAFRMVHILGALPVSGDAPAILSASDKLVEFVSLNRNGTVFGFTMQDSATPQEAYMAAVPTRGNLTVQSVSAENSDIAKMPVPKMEILGWKSSDGTLIEGILTYPLGYETGKKYPLVLSVHGGPAEKFSQSYFGQPDVYPYVMWSKNGYAILRINPRGSGGYGAAFRKANVANWNGGPYDDLMSGVDKVIAMGVADPARLTVVGWSYGGYMTANITTRTNRFKAAVVGAGPVNLVSQAGTSDLPEMIPAYMAAYPWEKPDVYRSQSPIFSVSKVKTPTMILHGTDDTRVPYSQGQEWHAALRALSVESTFVGYPRSGHVVREPQLMKDLQLRVLEWIERHLAADVKK